LVQKKLDWRGYQMVKTFDDASIHFDTTHNTQYTNVTDTRRTDRRTETARRHSVARQRPQLN